MRMWRISGLTVMLMGLSTLAFAQLPGEPKAPPSYDPAGDANYSRKLWAPDDRVREAQQLLQERGYYAGPTDGLMTPQTRRAVWKFQKDHDLTRTARLDAPTLAALHASPPSASPPSGDGHSMPGQPNMKAP